MNFAQEFFKKPLIQIEAADILRFFEHPQSEGQHLEFKSGEVKIDKLLKEICAFLNTSGGLLVLGAPREVELGPNDRGSVGEPSPSAIASVSMLREKISSGIVPSPKGIKLHQVRFEKGSVFLIEITPSSNPPHQLQGSGMYYLRQGHVSRPAMHQEIEKMFFEKRRPFLDLQVELERPDDAVLIRLIIENTTTASAEDPGFVLSSFPVRKRENGKFQLQRIAAGVYLNRGQHWVQEVEILPQNPRFFLSCHYFCKAVDMKQKAVFAEIQNNKIVLLEVFNSEVHDDFQWWYDRYSYLLNE